MSGLVRSRGVAMLLPMLVVFSMFASSLAVTQMASAQISSGSPNRYVIGDVPCRSKPSNSGSVLANMPNGAKVVVRGNASNGWQPVTCNGRAGYMPVSKLFVPKTKWINTPGWRGSRCMSRPSDTSSALDFMEQGGVVQMRASVIGEWTPVTCRSKAGFMLTRYLLDDRPAYPQTFYVRNTADRSGTYCRATPSLSGSRLVLLGQGSRIVTRGSARNGWTPVTCNGKAGYVKSSYLNVFAPPQDTMYISGASQGIACRAHASSSSAVLANLRDGDKVVSWEEATGGWTPVVCKGNFGYVPTRYLTGTPPSKAWSLYVVGTPNQKGVSCRATPSSTGRIMMVIPERGKVTMRGEIANGWWPVTCNGKAGWIDARYLSFTSFQSSALTPGQVVTPTPTVTPAPAPSPTPTPTVMPTQAPTATTEPTQVPTTVPTTAPTLEPTPTLEPIPTTEPTPEVMPTTEPTLEPTASLEPTSEPTPTPEPTLEPTPTTEPTPEPTLTLGTPTPTPEG